MTVLFLFLHCYIFLTSTSINTSLKGFTSQGVAIFILKFDEKSFVKALSFSEKQLFKKSNLSFISTQYVLFILSKKLYSYPESSTFEKHPVFNTAGLNGMYMC